MSGITKKLSPLTLLTTVAAISAALLTASPAPASAAQERTHMASSCGLYRDGDAAMYKNCAGANQNIFVTYWVGGNTYFCVPAGAARYVGQWRFVFRAYERGGC
ncbi:hypothetical protein [Nonomuraea sp. NPDC048826]|uniref:hypothetical protein n=1 Tax=Nonomuraea sp. NPDC048826 TaxID=3364347 RepID=UPI00371CAEAD